MLFGFLLLFLLLGGTVKEAFQIGCLWLFFVLIIEAVLWGSLLGLFALAFW